MCKVYRKEKRTIFRTLNFSSIFQNRLAKFQTEIKRTVISLSLIYLYPQVNIVENCNLELSSFREKIKEYHKYWYFKTGSFQTTGLPAKDKTSVTTVRNL